MSHAEGKARLLYIPLDLDAELKAVADSTDRSVQYTIVALLRLGMATRGGVAPGTSALLKQEQDQIQEQAQEQSQGF